MASCDDVRICALALAGVEEVDHWDRPALRTKRRIFITLQPAEGRAMFHLPEERQDFLFEAQPDCFAPLHWGKSTRCLVHLKNVPKREIAALVREAWEHAGPLKRVRTRQNTRAKVPSRRANR